MTEHTPPTDAELLALAQKAQLAQPFGDTYFGPVLRVVYEAGRASVTEPYWKAYSNQQVLGSWVNEVLGRASVTEPKPEPEVARLVERLENFDGEDRADMIELCELAAVALRAILTRPKPEGTFDSIQTVIERLLDEAGYDVLEPWRADVVGVLATWLDERAEPKPDPEVARLSREDLARIIDDTPGMKPDLGARLMLGLVRADAILAAASAVRESDPQDAEEER